MGACCAFFRSLLETVGVSFASQEIMDTAFDCRLSSQVPSSKDENAPYGAKTKSCAAVLFWHQKSTQKSAAVPHAADPRASQGAPAGAAVFPWHVRHSVLANAKSKAFAFTASRALPFARRPPWAGEGRCCACDEGRRCAFGEAV